MFPVVMMLAAAGPGQMQPVPPEPTAPATQPLKYPNQLPPAPHFHPPVEHPAPARKADLPDLADCLKACPSANDSAPFLRMPKVSVVEECRTDGTESKRDPANTWKHTWHTAARFTVPRFDQGGEPMDGDALVIYEGMVLSVDQTTGVYDLSFTATAPPTAVTLRLQLAFLTDPKAPAVRLTLPPIRIELDEAARSGDNTGRTVRVNHRGKSDLFVKALHTAGPAGPARTSDLDPVPVLDAGCKVIRLGTARFGSARINVDEQDR